MTTTSLAYCIVPKCPSTKKRNPEKLFFSVPSGKVRNKWSAVVRRTKISLKGSYYCCEDHFDPETDVEDWARYKILKAENKPVFRLKLKPGVLPHKFDCQPDRKITHTKKERSVLLKKRHLEIIQQTMTCMEIDTEEDIPTENLSEEVCIDHMEGVEVFQPAAEIEVIGTQDQASP